MCLFVYLTYLQLSASNLLLARVGVSTSYTLTTLHPSSQMNTPTDQSRMRRLCTSRVAQRVMDAGIQISTALSDTKRSLRLVASRTLLRLCLGQRVFRSQPVYGMQGENILGA
jgi:hypothetical protein